MSYPPLKVRIVPDALEGSIRRINESFTKGFRDTFGSMEKVAKNFDPFFSGVGIRTNLTGVLNRAEKLLAELRGTTIKVEKPTVETSVKVEGEQRVEKSKGLLDSFIAGAKGEPTGKGLGGLVGNVGKISAMLGIVGLAIEGIKSTIGAILNKLQESSPFLRGIMGIINTMGMLILKPIGDFIAYLLKPFVMFALRYLVLPFYHTVMPMVRAIGQSWEKFANSILKPIVELFSGKLSIEDFFKTILSNYVKGVFDFGLWLEKSIYDFWVGVFNFGKWLWESIPDFVQGIFNIGEWLAENVHKFIVGFFDFGRFLGARIQEYVRGFFDIGSWFEGGGIDRLIGGFFNFGEWFGKMSGIFIRGTFNIGEWLLKSFREFVVGIFDLGKWLVQMFGEYVKGVFNIGEWLYTNIPKILKGEFDIGAYLEKLIMGFASSFNKGIAPYMDDITKSLNKMSSVASGIVSVVKNRIGGIFTEVYNVLKMIWDKLSGFLKTITGAEVTSNISNAVTNALNSLSSGISNTVSTVTNAVSSTVSAVTNAVSMATSTAVSTITNTANVVNSAINETVSGTTTSGGTRSTYGSNEGQTVGGGSQTGGLRVFQHGGFVMETGLAYLHAGEYVMPKERVSSVTNPTTINVTVNVEKVSSDVDVENMALMIERRLYDRVVRGGRFG